MKKIKQIALLQLVLGLFWAHVAQAQTDITSSGGTLTNLFVTAPLDQGVTNVFDHDSNTKFVQYDDSASIQYQPNIPAVLTKYTLTSANDAEERDPKNWTLKASSNGTTWVTLDTQTNQDFAARFQKNDYSLSNTTAYRYYRLDMTNNSGPILQLAEWGLLGALTPVTVFKNVNYAGKAVTLPIGSYTLTQLKATGIANDWVSSATVSASYQITFYENDNFGGASLVKTADDPTLADDGWNNRVSSLIISAAPINTALTPPSQLVATKISTSQINLTWQDNSTSETLFRIWRSTNATNFVPIATVGTNISSYSDTGLTFDTQYNYQVRAENSGGSSSFSGTASASTSGAEYAAIVYADCNYTGSSAVLPWGSYTTAQLQALGLGNNAISSLKVASGYHVVLYDGDNFTGASVDVTADNVCLTGNLKFNDLASSLRVMYGAYRQMSPQNRVGSSSVLNPTDAYSKELSVFPNPGSQTVSLTGVGSFPVTISLYDTKGTEVRQLYLEQPSESVALNIGDLTGGVYLIRALSKTGVQTQRLIKY